MNRLNILTCFFGVFLSINSVVAVAEEPIKPVTIIPYDRDKAAIGKLLFADVRLSGNDSLSCASCHILDQGGDDNVARSIGINGKPSKRNSPTVFNTGFNFLQLWDGRADSLEQQVKGVITSKAVMGMESWDDTVEKIAGIEQYNQAFQEVYGKPIEAKHIQEVIAEYERSLVLVNSPFDQYLNGDESAISDTAKTGYALFKSYGCISCHQGVNVGGNMFQKIGVLKDINLRDPNDVDLGRHNITGNEWDKRVFKVPSLRLVVQTAPYFHDGSVKTLRDAIDIMTEYQLGRKVPDEHKTAIMEFLATLPGELPTEAK